MVNNQIEFNKGYSNKEVLEIEIKRKNFQGELIIGGYSELKTLNLRDNKSINKVILKNLPQLQECVIWNCGTQVLVIENCPQIKNLNICKNLLTNLEFLKNLENLEELKFDGNPKLTEILKPYQGDWRICQEDIQELIKSIRENPQTLSELREKYANLKNFLKETWVLLSEEKQGKLINKLDDEIKNQEQKASGLSAAIEDLKTTELILNLKKSLESIKELRELKEVLECELGELKSKNQKLEVGLIKEKEEQLEKLEREFINKGVSLGKKKEKLQDDLRIYLDANNSQFAKEKSKERLLKLKAKWPSKKEKESSELAELLKELWGKQISLLEAKGETAREIKNKDITDIVYDLEKAKVEEINPDVVLRKQVSNLSDSDTKQSEKYTYKKSKTRTWNNSFGIEMGVNISVTAGIPALAEGKVVLNPKINYTYQQGSSEIEESVIESSSEFNVPANSKGEVIISAKRVKISVPFKYTELITYNDGKTENFIKNGIYEGIESYHEIKVGLKIEKIIEQSRAQILSK